jgi:hypothetical protein
LEDPVVQMLHHVHKQWCLPVTGQGGVHRQDSRERRAKLELARDKGVRGLNGSRPRGNDCIRDRQSKIQDVA